MSTLLQIVQDATGELGIPQPASVVTSGDPQVVQIYNLAKRELRELQQAYNWTALQTLFVINLNTVQTSTGDLLLSSGTILNVSPTVVTALNTPKATAWTVTDTTGLLPVATRVLTASGTTVTLDSNSTGTLVGASIQFSQDTYNMPTDFDRYIGQTWWDRTNRWALLGPDSPQVDEWHRSGIAVIGPRRHFRQVGLQPTAWRIWPPLTTATTNPQELVFEYISQNVVLVSGGPTTAVTWGNDADVPIMDDQAIRLGIKWRWMQAKRYQYADLQAEYLDYVDRLKARDGGNQILSMSPMVDQDYLITSRSVQDGYFPGSSNVTGQ